MSNELDARRTLIVTHHLNQTREHNPMTFAIRPFQWDDLPAIVEIMNAVRVACGDDERYTLDEVRHDYQVPDFDPLTDCFVAVDQAGRVIGVDNVEIEVPFARGWSEGFVHPDCWRQGIGAALLARTDAYLLAYLSERVPEPKPLVVYRHAPDFYAGALALFKASSYTTARYFYRMQIEFDGQIDAPALPDRFTLRPFDLERDMRAVYLAQQESFRDHWGHEDGDMPYELWQHYIINTPDFNPALWLIACDGDEIAGVCLNRRYGDDQPDMGWINTLGVRRPWRRRGLGAALLRMAFHVLQAHGFRRAGLGVDAASPTNAVALYERAGMTVSKRTVVWRKALRGSVDEVKS